MHHHHSFRVLLAVTLLMALALFGTPQVVPAHAAGEPKSSGKTISLAQYEQLSRQAQARTMQAMQALHGNDICDLRQRA